jgi:PAS domain S-box-containing protein
MRVSARLVVFVGLSIAVTAGSCVVAVGLAGGWRSLPWALLPTAIVAATAGVLARRFLLHAGELEQALRRESAQRDRILNSVPAMVFMKDTSNKLVWVNDAYVEAMGMSRERLLSKPVGELFPEADAHHYFDDDRKVMQSGVPIRGIVETVQTENGIRWVRTDKLPVRDERGEVTGILGFAFDITPLKQVERELTARNAFIETVMDNLPIGIVVSDANLARATYMNRMFERIFGWPRDVLEARDRFTAHVYPDPIYRAEVDRMMRDGVASGEADRMSWDGIRIVTGSGETRFIAAARIPLRDQGSMVTTAVDVTEKLRASEEIRRINAELERRVAERTTELRGLVDLMAGREIRMSELKHAIRELRGQLEKAGLAPVAGDPLLNGEVGGR